MKKQATKRVPKDLPARNDSNVTGGGGEITITKPTDTTTPKLY